MRIGGAAGPALGRCRTRRIGSYRPVMAAAAVGFLPSLLPLRPFDFGASRTTLKRGRIVASPRITISRGDKPESHARDNQSGPSAQPGDKRDEESAQAS
jgi:hypothetical protein